MAQVWIPKAHHDRLVRRRYIPITSLSRHAERRKLVELNSTPHSTKILEMPRVIMNDWPKMEILVFPSHYK